MFFFRCSWYTNSLEFTWPHQMTIKMGIFLLQSKSWSFNQLERPKYMTMWSLYLEQFQAFQELQDKAKLKWIQDEEFMCNSTIKGTWIVISCTILTINTTVKIRNMATNPVSIYLNKVIDTGQVHSEDQCRGIDLDRGTATHSSQNYPRSSNSSVTRIMQRNGKYN